MAADPTMATGPSADINNKDYFKGKGYPYTYVPLILKLFHCPRPTASKQQRRGQLRPTACFLNKAVMVDGLNEMVP